MAKGDHIKVKKVVRLKKPVRLKTIGYWHHGIDCGDGTVIHFRHGLIKRTSMQYFLGRRRRKGIVVRHRYSFPADKVVARAEMCLGRKGYNLLFNNCEHFAHWCKTGRKRSKQVNKAAYRAGTAATTTAVGISVGLWSSCSYWCCRLWYCQAKWHNQTNEKNWSSNIQIKEETLTKYLFSSNFDNVKCVTSQFSQFSYDWL